jgi:Effector Associated Constant Component 1
VTGNSLPWRVLAGLFGVERDGVSETEASRAVGHSLPRRVLAGLFGVPLPPRRSDTADYMRVPVAFDLKTDALPPSVEELSRPEFTSPFTAMQLKALPATYISRDIDTELRSMLRAASMGADRRVVVVTGPAGSGKTSSALKAISDVLPKRKLLEPDQVHTSLHEISQWPTSVLREAVVWLNDVERYAHADFSATLDRLLDAGAVVVATIRTSEIDNLLKGNLAEASTGRAITDISRSQLLAIPLTLTSREQERTLMLVNPGRESVRAITVSASPDLRTWLIRQDLDLHVVEASNVISGSGEPDVLQVVVPTMGAVTTLVQTIRAFLGTARSNESVTIRIRTEGGAEVAMEMTGAAEAHLVS